MAQLIIANEDRDFAKVIQAKMIQRYGFESIIFQDISQITSMLGLLPDIQMVIATESMHKKICDHLIRISNVEDNQQIKVLVLGVNKSLYPYITVIPSTLAIDKIVHHAGFVLNLETTAGYDPEVEVAAIIKVEPKKIEVAVEDNQRTTIFKMPKHNPEVSVEQIVEHVADYVGINSKMLMHLDVLENDFDIFSRIKKGGSYEYNLKVSANAGMLFSEFEKLKNRIGKEIFVKKTDLSKAQEYFGKNFIARFNESELSMNDRMVLNSDSFDLLVDVFKNSSFTKISIEIIKELVKSFQLIVKSPDSISLFWNGMKEHDLSYIYAHGHLSCMLVLRVMEDFEWRKDQSANKVIYLCIFHDLCLHSNKLVKAHHKYKDEVDNLTETEREILNNHADNSAVILENIVMAPKELTTMIREHHGIKAGNRFSDELSIVINPLNMAFIVVEEFVTKYLSVWEALNKPLVSEFMNKNIDFIFDELKVKFNKLTYHETLLALKNKYKS